MIAGVAIVAVIGACGGGDDLRDDVADTLSRSYGLDAEEAECVAGYAVEQLPADGLRSFADDGIAALPSDERQRFGEVFVACTAGDR